MVKITILQCDFPWIVYFDREQAIADRYRNEIVQWLCDNIGKDQFTIEDDSHVYKIMFRFKEKTDAHLFKLRFEGTP